MRAQLVVPEPRGVLADWMSRKSVRVTVLLGVLLTVSIVVNALIIFAAGIRP